MEEALQLQAEVVEADEHRCLPESTSSVRITCDP
jgi:hypothetical protein